LKKIILLIGMPGSGKSTIGKICESYGYTYISSSILLTQAGFDSKYSRNMLDEAVLELIKKDISKANDNSTIIIEGFSRSLAQLEMLEQEFHITKAIYLKIPKSVAKKRVLERIVCSKCGKISTINQHKQSENEEICDICGGILTKREGDNKKIFEIRVGYFAKNTYPVIKYLDMQNKLITVDATRPIDEIALNIKSL